MHADDNVLFNKYRPVEFSDVFGQDSAVKALSNAITKKTSRQFMLVGPSGTGKTTLARIAARAYGCEASGILEIDGASNTGIDDMRSLQATMQYLPLIGSMRAVIIDEAHRLSAQAWDSLLKSIEEPPPHVVWFLCSTNAGKIPVTIHRRCLSITLKAVSDADILYLVDFVAGAEGYQLADGVAKICARTAAGSPGKALVNLAKCAEAESEAEARELCRDVAEFPVIPKLCQFLLKGGSWATAVSIINECAGQENESIRIACCHYFAAVLKNSGKSNPGQIFRLVGILDAFMQQPYRTSDGLAPIYISVASAMWPNGPPA